MAGIPTYQPDHALRVTKFAIEASKAAAAVPVSLTDLSKGFISLRVRSSGSPWFEGR